MSSHMLPATHKIILKKFDEPIEKIYEFNDAGYPIDEVKIRYSAMELAYDIGNFCPNNEQKEIALSLLGRVVDYINESFTKNAVKLKEKADGK